MDLYETDEKVLLSLINNGDASELILYNFATDLMYSESIQSDLMNATLPFYFSSLEKAILGVSSDNLQIISKFNDALFFNKERIVDAISITRFRDFMDLYETCLVHKVNKSEVVKMDWISWCNTFFALDETNIASFFKNFYSNLDSQGQTSYFLYLTGLLFRKADNLFLEEIQEIYESPILWEFQSDQVDGFYWSSEVGKSFRSFVTIDFVKDLFSNVAPYLAKTFEEENVSFIECEVYSKETVATFELRRNEFLEKISDADAVNNYWSDAF